MSREEDLNPHITSQFQAANHGLHSPSTTAIPKSPRAMRGFAGRGGTSSRMGLPLCRRSPAIIKGHPRPSSITSTSNVNLTQDILLSLSVPWMDSSGWTMDRAQMDLVLHSSSSSRWMGIRSSSVKVQLKPTGAEVVPNPQMPPYINHHSHPMDTHLPLILVIVNMHIPHMRQHETPRCLSPLRLSPLHLTVDHWQ